MKKTLIAELLTGRSLDQLMHLKRMLSSLPSCPKAVHYIPSFQSWYVVTYAGGSFDNAAIFESFLFLKVTIHQCSCKWHLLTKLDIGGVCTLSCHWLSIWEIELCGESPQEKFCHTTAVQYWRLNPTWQYMLFTDEPSSMRYISHLNATLFDR